MNKTDAILWAARLHEAIRTLPANADVFDYALHYDCNAKDKRVLSIHLAEPVDWSPVISGKRFSGWTEKCIAVTPFATAWWAQDEVDSNDNG